MSEKWEIGQIINEHYEIFDIKKGGMGLVCTCYNKLDQEMIVLKTFQDRYLSNNQVVKRFIQEATTWIHLEHHRNIVRAFSVTDIYFRPYIFLEYIASDFNHGLDLADHMEGRLLPIEMALDFALQFCEGMMHAEEKMQHLGKHFVHADIKPANILIQNKNSIKITDFGLSRAFDDKDATSGWGTLAYMSPEQFTKTSLDVRSDIYSFGCVLYEMVTGTRPFIVDEKMDLALARKLYRDQHFQELPKAPEERRSDCPTGLNDVILQCLEKNPAKRFPDFCALRQELAGIFSRMTGQAIHKSPESIRLPDRDMIEKSISLIDLGHYQDAVICLDKALSTVQDSGLQWIARCSRGSAFAAMGLREEALADYEEALRLSPAQPLSYNGRANLYNNTGELHKALSDYDTAIALDATYVIAIYNRGICHRRLEHYENALADFSRAIELGHYESFTNRGSTYLNLGRNQEALSDFQKALEFYPRNSIALMNTGTIQEEQGQDKEAVEYYSRAIEITPFYLVPYFKRAYLLAKEKNYLAAIEDYEKALSIDPSCIPKDASVDYSLSKTELDLMYPLIFHDCGVSYLKIGNYLRGKEFLQRFLETASPHHRDKIGPVAQVLAWVDDQLGIC